MLSTLASGMLVRDPKSGTSASGTRWANSTLRVPCGKSREGDSETAFITVCAFGDQADQLARLAKGDSISVQGTLKSTEYVKDGETRHGLEIMANALLSPYQLKQKRGTDTASHKPEPDSWRVYDRARQDFDDEPMF